MAELADAYGSGPYESNFMQVQVLLPAPKSRSRKWMGFYFLPLDSHSAISPLLNKKRITAVDPFWIYGGIFKKEKEMVESYILTDRQVYFTT